VWVGGVVRLVLQGGGGGKIGATGGMEGEGGGLFVLW
jgi:hypothetical protein